MIDIDEEDGTTFVWWRLVRITGMPPRLTRVTDLHLLAYSPSRGEALRLAEQVLLGELTQIQHQRVRAEMGGKGARGGGSGSRGE
jgi:hypothetical protein